MWINISMISNKITEVKTQKGEVQAYRYNAEGLRHEMEENGRLVAVPFLRERSCSTVWDSPSRWRKTSILLPLETSIPAACITMSLL